VVANNVFGGTYDARTNPVVRARVTCEVINQVTGTEKSTPHTEGEGSGETVFKRFRITALWSATAGRNEGYAEHASRGPDATAPTPPTRPTPDLKRPEANLVEAIWLNEEL
jgi:hypothetical protein